MTISSELEILKTNLQNSYTSAANKGAILPQVQSFSNLSATIATIAGSSSNTYGIDLAYEYTENLLNSHEDISNDILYNVLNGTSQGQHAPLSGSWEYKPCSYKEYFRDVLTSDNAMACEILVSVRDGV